MKRKFFCSMVLAALLLLMSCGKTCRCYRYDGNYEEFDVDELKEQNKSCSSLEDVNYGMLYSLCEKVVI